ncbi:MAG: ATP-dependent RecD-like DNA helicase [Eubacteriales bacterium]|nr:ATP-dependent RecD-like DNA helicase [Eubacteriales bacterium]
MRQLKIGESPPENPVLEGMIADIIFRNEQNGYTVCTLRDETVVVGTLPFIHPGETVRFTGRWVDHPDYGRQFQADHFELAIPRTAKAIRHYLASGLIQGIGEKTADRLVRAFGEATLDILRDEPERVARLKGIGPNRARQFAEQLQEKAAYQDLMMLLGPLGVGTGIVMRIYRHYGRQALDVLSENPYALADEVDGIGFLTADRLAQDLGLDPTAMPRLSSAFLYVLNQASNRGHTALPLTVCLDEVRQLTGQPVDAGHEVIRLLLSEQRIFMADNQTLSDSSLSHESPQLVRLCATATTWHAEKKSAELLIQLLRSPPRLFRGLSNQDEVQSTVRRACERQNLTLAPEQAQAIEQALAHSISILTGGPGTGKTTIIRILCDCMEQQGGRILLAAPTGRAARRMSDASGREAKTLHRLLSLGFAPDKDRDQPDEPVELACDLLIVDEVSMMDVFLFRSLLTSLVAGTRVLLVGDADQLPSVGPGDVLNNLITSGILPVTRLTKIFRQSEESLIIRNAHRIHAGDWPFVDQSLHSSFLVIYKEHTADMAAAAIRLCQEILPQQYQLDPLRDVQVLTPVRKGVAGTQNLNTVLQAALNPVTDPDQEDAAVTAHGSRFATGDKVMHIRNNYELAWTSLSDTNSKGQGVFNGETGTVVKTDPDSRTVYVLYDDDRLTAYDPAVMDDLDLAYAMTIHKSQGSEYPVVVLVLPPGAPQLLTRNLLYTAVTRASEKLLLISSRATLGGMIRNNTAYLRHTLLPEWLRRLTAEHDFPQ